MREKIRVRILLGIGNRIKEDIRESVWRSKRISTDLIKGRWALKEKGFFADNT